MHTRTQLIEQGQYPDLQQLQIDAASLQQRLQKQEALVFCLSLADYKLEQEPHLIILQHDSIDDLQASSLLAACQAIQIINHLQPGAARSLRHNTFERSATQVPTDHNEAGQTENAWSQLNSALTTCWQQLATVLPETVQSVHLVTHGDLHNLPWQYVSPFPHCLLYPGLHVYLQRHTTPETPTLCPARARPLTLLHHAAEQHPLQRLYHVPIEVAGIRAIWGETQVDVCTRLPALDAQQPRLLIFIGHGHFQAGQASMLVEDGQLDQHTLLNQPQNLHALSASACLLGQTQDLINEPLGLLSLAASRNDLHFHSGALLPVDDWYCTCLSLLFHYHWHAQQGNPQQAMHTALHNLRSSDWPQAFVDGFKTVLCQQLPDMLQAIQQDADLYEGEHPDRLQQRHQFIRFQWTDNKPKYASCYQRLTNPHQAPEQRHHDAALLADYMLSKREQINDALFVPFWMWG